VPAAGWSALLRRDLLRPVRTALQQAGLALTPLQLVAASAVLGLGLGLAGLLLQGLLPGLAAGAAAPFVWMAWKRRGQRARFLNQLPAAFELMARVLRSGQSVPGAFQAVADSFEEPLGSAFARCREQQNLGLTAEAALEDMAEHTGLLDVRIFVVALLIQRQAGGNLSEVLERLAALARERARMCSKIRALTGEGRMQAGVLLVLPFFLFVVMRFVNRSYADALFEHGWLVLATVVAMLVGTLWIRKIVDFEV
jgi:tight adherence protein B